jgi:predicted transcriptional regulator
VWEDAIDRGLVMRKPVKGESRTRVEVTEAGKRFLREHGRLPAH